MSKSNCEEELLSKVSTGDQFAFRELFTKYHQHLGNYIFQITDSTELAEEIVQDVFMKLWTNRQSLEKVQNFKAYLFVVSKNHALNCLRKIVRERLLKTEWENNLLHTPEYDDAEEYYKLLDQAIDQLPPQQKKVYLLSRHRRMKYLEISAEMNISAETVKKYLKLANAAITSYMRDHLESILILLAFYRKL